MTATLEELYQDLSAVERAIIASAIFDPIQERGLSICRLYFPGHPDETILAFLNGKKCT